jgi:hypothetical protein
VDICFREVFALVEKQRLLCNSERIGETVPVVETCRMPTFTETAEVSITVVIYGKRCSELCDGLQFVEKCVALAPVTCA